MLRLQKQGFESYAIATRLNRKGLNPRTGRRWTRASVAAILRTAERRAEVLA